MLERPSIVRAVLLLLVFIISICFAQASDHCTCEPTAPHWQGWDSTFELPDLGGVFRQVVLAADQLKQVIADNARQLIENARNLQELPAFLDLAFVNVKLKNSTLHWDPISGADGYRVFIRSGDINLVTSVVSNWVSLPVDILCAGDRDSWDVTLRATIDGELLVEVTGIRVFCA